MIFFRGHYRGIPKVTFISPLPAKWKVLRVIWVEGSPIDWAARRPTASPGSHSERCHLYCKSCLRLNTEKLSFFHITDRHNWRYFVWFKLEFDWSTPMYCCTGEFCRYLWASRLSSFCRPLSSRYPSVIWWKFSDTDPKQMSGLKMLSEGSGQRDDFLQYLDLLDSSREYHCCRTWTGLVRMSLGQS